MRFRALLAFGLGLFSSLISASALAEEPLPPLAAAAPPQVDLPPPSARTNLIITGAATTLVSYGLAFGASYLFTEEDDLCGAKQLRIPIAGPWLALGKTGCPTNNPGCSAVPLVLGALLNVLDGVAQAGGLGVLGEGLFLNTSSARPAPPKAQGPTVHAVPFNFEAGGVGLGVIGTF